MENEAKKENTANENKRKIKIAGIGSYTPDKVLANVDLEKMVDTSDEWIVTRTGIKERRIGSDDQATSDLGIEAGRLALKDAGLTADDIDLILVATNTTDTPFPSTACWIQKGLKADHVPAFDISAGCTGFIYGMIIAESLILSGKNKRILLLSPEMLSKEKVFVNIHKYGNMSVATVPVGLAELYQEGKLKKDDIIVMDAFGAGFTWAALVYRW